MWVVAWQAGRQAGLPVPQKSMEESGEWSGCNKPSQRVHAQETIALGLDKDGQGCGWRKGTMHAVNRQKSSNSHSEPDQAIKTAVRLIVFLCNILATVTVYVE